MISEFSASVPEDARTDHLEALPKVPMSLW